jgi:hypothetical protein
MTDDACDVLEFLLSIEHGARQRTHVSDICVGAGIYLEEVLPALEELFELGLIGRLDPASLQPGLDVWGVIDREEAEAALLRIFPFPEAPGPRIRLSSLAARA